jgi:hypothetical protein
MKIMYCVEENNQLCLSSELCALDWMYKYNDLYRKINERASVINVREKKKLNIY